MNLSERKQSIVALSALAARGELVPLRAEIDAALERGLTVNDIGEIFLQLYAYAGFPKSLNAQSVLKTVIDGREASGRTVVYGTTPGAVSTENRYDTGRETANAIFGHSARQSRPAATGYAETTDVFLKEHLFADITNRDNMNTEERELATVSMLAGIGNVNPQLAAHFGGALNSGNTPGELKAAVEVIAAKVGKPEGKNAAAVLDAALGLKDSAARKAEPESAERESGAAERGLPCPPAAKVSAFPAGRSNDAYAQYFSGRSYLAPLTDPKKTAVFIANVTFEPGCRNNWHVHRAKSGGGQILICVGGRGWYQEEGKAARALRPGDVVSIPANVKHWHGAAADSWFAHLAAEVPGTETGSEWLEPVSDAEYGKLK